MKLLTKFGQLSWKMRIAIFLSALWFLFWIFLTWEQETLLWGFAFGGFPVFFFWCIWLGLSQEKDPDTPKYIKVSKYIMVQQKRKFVRLEYPPTKRPLLKIGGYELEIIDISERGLKLLNDKKAEFGRSIHGEAVLLSGKTLIVKGKVSRRLINETTLIINPIRRSIIAQEKRVLSKTQRNLRVSNVD